MNDHRLIVFQSMTENEWCSVGDISKRCGLNSKQIEQAIKSLLKGGLIEGEVVYRTKQKELF